MCECDKAVISVLIVDDTPVVRDGLAGYIGTTSDMEVVGQTGNGIEAVRMAEELVPDVVIMDIVLRDSEIDGSEATRRITSSCPNTQVLALSAFDGDDKVFPTLKAGAMGYLLKTSSSDLVLAAIRQVAHRHPYLDARIYRKLTDFLSVSGVPVEQGDIRPRLTPREQEVLQLLARSMTNRQIADELVISVKTVRTHVSNILQKLHLSDRTQARYWAIRQGMTDQEDDQDAPAG